MGNDSSKSVKHNNHKSSKKGSNVTSNINNAINKRNSTTTSITAESHKQNTSHNVHAPLHNNNNDNNNSNNTTTNITTKTMTNTSFTNSSAKAAAAAAAANTKVKEDIKRKSFEQSANIPVISKVKTHSQKLHVDSPLYNNQSTQTFPRHSLPRTSISISGKTDAQELEQQQQQQQHFSSSQEELLSTLAFTVPSVPRYVDANSLLYSTPLDPYIDNVQEEPHNTKLGSVTQRSSSKTIHVGEINVDSSNNYYNNNNNNNNNKSSTHHRNNSSSISSTPSREKNNSFTAASTSSLLSVQLLQSTINTTMNMHSPSVASPRNKERPVLPLSASVQNSNLKVMSPNAPLLCSFPHLASNTTATQHIPAPIVIPTYNTINSSEDETSCGSPMLRSYRHSVSFRDNTQSALSSSFISYSAVLTTTTSTANNINNNNNNNGHTSSSNNNNKSKNDKMNLQGSNYINVTGTIPVGSPFANGLSTIPSNSSFNSFPFGPSSSVMLSLSNFEDGNNHNNNNINNNSNRSYNDVFTGGSPQMNSSLNLKFSPASLPFQPSYTSSKPLIHTEFLEINGYPLGLENFGNTCYSNSVIQLLYHCTPLRLRLLEISEVYENKKGGVGFETTTLLCELCKLIKLMHKSNNYKRDKRRMRIAPMEFMECVRDKNAEFHANAQQDAHEFAMFVMNNIMETERVIMSDPKNRLLFSNNKDKKNSFAFWRSSKSKMSKRESAIAATMNSNNNNSNSTTNTKRTSLEADSKSNKKGKANNSFASSSNNNNINNSNSNCYDGCEMTPLQAILQGKFGSLTACLECGTVKSRSEVFIDLSLETSQGSSLLNCLQHYGDPECFFGSNKVHCDHCNRSVQAAKTIHVEQLPQYALMIHLKRFCYDYKRQSFNKKVDHVALPLEMDVEEYEPCDVDDDDDYDYDNNHNNDNDKLTGSEPLAETPEHDEQRWSQQADNNHNSNNSNSSNSKNENENEKSVNDKEESPPSIPLHLRRKLRGVARHKARFALTGFVVHMGEGPNEGHYFTCIRYGPQH